MYDKYIQRPPDANGWNENRGITPPAEREYVLETVVLNHGSSGPKLPVGNKQMG